MGHKFSDNDAVGASVAMEYFCRQNGVNAKVVIDEKKSLAGPLIKYLEDNGFEIQSCEFVRIPNDTKTLSDEEMESVQKLIDRIEEDEDVQNVFTNIG